MSGRNRFTPDEIRISDDKDKDHNMDAPGRSDSSAQVLRNSRPEFRLRALQHDDNHYDIPLTSALHVSLSTVGSAVIGSVDIQWS